jgi:hypothetical protein
MEGGWENSEHPWPSKAEIAFTEALLRRAKSCPTAARERLGGCEQAVDQVPAARCSGRTPENPVPREKPAQTVPGCLPGAGDEEAIGLREGGDVRQLARTSPRYPDSPTNQESLLCSPT